MCALTSHLILATLGDFETILCVAALCLIVARKQWSDYSALSCFLAVRIVSNVILTYLHFYARSHYAINPHAGYSAYFYTYWISGAVESVLTLLIVYSVIRLAMEPLKGLQTLGMLVFKWAAGISVAVALGSAVTPDMTGTKYIMDAISQLQRTQSILTLCLLLFVTFAVRPMGLSYSSRIFGVSLGLGIISTNDLVQSAWLALNPHMGGAYNYVLGIVSCLVLATWTAYFALPEPKRRMIVLPTTSPFLRWNQISQALGDSPGFVAIGGVPPELFAPAELEVMRRASLKMVTPFPSASERIHVAPAPQPERISASAAI